MSSLRTPLSRVRGLGSAKEGLSHWWMQRLTSLALIPLVLWFTFSIAILPGLEYKAFLGWIGSPMVAVSLVLAIIATFYHMQLGLQVIIEDYIHIGWLKLSSIVLIDFLCIALAVIGIIAVLRIAL